MTEPSAACRGKKMYFSRRDAKKAARKLPKTSFYEGDKRKRLHAYRCPCCKHFHIGHEFIGKAKQP